MDVPYSFCENTSAVPALAGDTCITLQRLLQVMDPAIPYGDLAPKCYTRELVQYSVKLRNVSPKTKESLCFIGPELYIQPEELLQENVDNFNLSPVVKDKLFRTFGVGDHPSGLFIVL